MGSNIGEGGYFCCFNDFSLTWFGSFCWALKFSCLYVYTYTLILSCNLISFEGMKIRINWFTGWYICVRLIRWWWYNGFFLCYFFVGFKVRLSWLWFVSWLILVVNMLSPLYLLLSYSLLSVYTVVRLFLFFGNWLIVAVIFVGCGNEDVGINWVKASSCNGCDLFCWAFDSLSFWLCLSDFMGFWISD